MTTTPIPASLATACAAHDRHRLDVLDALLDEAAPSAVRELLGAALDLCATLRTERDELRAKLDAALTAEREAGRGLVAQVEALRAEAATACANLNRCDDERASAIGERDAAIARAEKAEAERDALRLRVTEDERDERSADAEIAKLRAELAELRARPVLTVEALTEAIGATTSIGAGTRGRTIAGDIIAALGPVTLPSPDRAEELTAAIYGDSFSELRVADRLSMVRRTKDALAKLTPAPARPATAAKGG